MRPDSPPNAHAPPSRSLIVLLLTASAALGWILLPFYAPILWGTVLAMLFVPWYRRLLPRLHGHRSIAALITLMAASLIVVLPVVLVASALANEVLSFYGRIQSGELAPTQYLREVFTALPAWVRDLFGRLGMSNFDALQRRLNLALAGASQWLGGQALGLGQDTLDVVMGLGITLYLAFFLIRDGDDLTRLLRHAVPLPPAHARELAEKFGTVIRATVKGNLLVALTQGALGGLAFWYLGVGAALMWAVLMAFLSMVPAVGAAIVWLPVALYFMAIGAFGKAFALIAWGVVVVGLVDNLLRPMLVGRDTGLPDWVVLLATLGGLATIGINGLVIGPAIAAMFVAVWHLHLASSRGEPPERRSPPEPVGPRVP